MSQTQSSYDFDHFTEQSIVPQQQQQDTFKEGRSVHFEEDQAYSEQQPYEQQPSEYESSDMSIVQPPVSFLQSTFQQLDKEGRGVITKSVLKRATMVTADHYDKRIIREEIDKCDKEINYSRFVQIFERANVGDGGINEWLFSLYDRDKKGFIDRSDLLRVAELAGVEVGEEEAVQMLGTERNRGSGRVDYEDFRFIMEEEIQYM